MATLQYKVIKNSRQYYKYCDILEGMLVSESKSKSMQDEIELITLLIETYDKQHTSLFDSDPIEILISLMKDHKIKAIDLAKMLGVSKGLISDILNYRKGLSKQTIRLLSEKFKLNQELFNRPYVLKGYDLKKQKQLKKYSKLNRFAKAS